MTNDKLELLDKQLRELRKELEDDLLKYGNSYLVIPERCSCGARQKSKCVKENGFGGGKMCLKEDNIQSIHTDEQRLLIDPEYSKQWVEEEVRKSGQWFLEEIYK